MDVIFDVSVLIPALIKTGRPKGLRLKCVNKELNLLCSKETLDEFVSVAGGGKSSAT